MNTPLLLLIIITALVSYRGFNESSFFRKFQFHIGSIQGGDQYRMISSGFLHADVMHLAFNMLTLWFFAPVIIGLMGYLSFVLIYLGSLVCGNLLTLYFYRDQPHYTAVGASGAVTGVLYSAILLQPSMTLGLFFVVPVPAYLFGILYLLYAIYGMKSKSDNIGHSAHFGGAIGGLIITLIKEPNLFFDHSLMVMLLIIPIIVLFAMSKKGKI